MKTWMQKTFALALAAALLCGSIVGVSAAGDEAYYNRIDAAVTPAAGYDLEFQNAAGTAVEKVLDTVGEDEMYVYKNVIKLKLTLDAPVEDQQYVAMLLSGEETIPTKDNICYIDQDTAENGFTLYPNQLSAPGNYNVVVSSVDGKDTVATFNVVEPPYILGDIDGSKQVNAGDATQLLRYIAGLTKPGDTVVLAAADVDGSGTVNAGDATRLLRNIAGLP